MRLIFETGSVGGALLLLALVACGGNTIPSTEIVPTPTAAATNQPRLQPTQTTEPRMKKLRFLALGDSYTIGQSVEVSDRWPAELVRRMRDAGSLVSDPEIIAQTGWTTGELSEAIDEAAPEGIFDIVSLLIGVNNQFRGRDIGQYQTEFADLLHRAINFAGGDPSRVIVVSIPDWGVTPFARGRDVDLIAQQIDLFNSVNRAETMHTGARYVNVTGISRQAVAEPRLVADDGLHPSGEMYSRWVDVVLPVALEIPPVSKSD